MKLLAMRIAKLEHHSSSMHIFRNVIIRFFVDLDLEEKVKFTYFEVVDLLAVVDVD